MRLACTMQIRVIENCFFGRKQNIYTHIFVTIIVIITVIIAVVSAVAVTKLSL